MLVKNLVEMHGGTVEAHSPGLGQGSEFIVSLPVVSEPPKTEAEEPLDAKRGSGKEPITSTSYSGCR